MNEHNQLLNEEQEKLSDEDLEITQKEKEEISFDVIKDKGDLNPVILSKERIDFDEDESEEEKPKLTKRKRKNLSRMTVTELQQRGGYLLLRTVAQDGLNFLLSLRPLLKNVLQL
ncbi:hypothetical protein TNCV_363351 [Trichonephila clavipes]|nr:hypothetical protein TNCV_363351 [Trichonephila clavipes]